ncbi:MAG: hypothetical protein IT168_32260 [Bryobacterales bacterium]|nr:hypothetical protein [Bryobacterales bacterium]
MRRIVIALAAVAICLAAPSKIARAQLKVLESTFDQRITRANIDDPFDVLGSTRAVYIDGYGIVLSNEVNLVIGPAITPFRPKLTPEEIEKLRHRKLTRLPQMRQLMRDMMITCATQLRAMPPEEQVVLGTTLFFFSWEDRRDLPEQIVMKAQRKALLDVEAGKSKADAVIQEQAF